MEEAQTAMETQPEASGQPTEQPTADAPPADAVPAPFVTPPPAVPVKAPPPSLLAKEEAKDNVRCPTADY